MSFKSLLQDMKGELGGSKKGVAGKSRSGSSSVSNRAVRDSSGFVVDAFKQSCWANMPPEMLREVLMRIEDSECTWPERRSVIACAGVCRSWRETMKDIVQTLQLSGKLSFPVSLKQPGPRDCLIQCFIKRNRGNQWYHLYQNLNQACNDEGKFMLAARRCRRPTYSDYIISLNPDDASRCSSNYIGKLRSNLFRTKFTVYDAQATTTGAKITKSLSTITMGMKQVSPRAPAGNYTVAHVSYGLNILGSRGPRRMHCVMDAIPASATDPHGVAPTQIELLPASLNSSPSRSFHRSKSIQMGTRDDETHHSDTEGILVLKNKAPRWHEQLQCWCLNFNGRVTVASVKNFQLVVDRGDLTGEDEQEKVILQFGKVGRDVFTMDYQYPISAFQAFAICLSSFDTKIACE